MTTARWSRFAGTSRRRLLALLGLRAGEVVSTGRIVEELWGDQEIRDPLNAVQVVVSKLRRAAPIGVRVRAGAS